MCIIAIKNKGLQLPNEEILYTMFKNNPDGGGFAYSHNGQVVIKKGFMTFSEFYKALQTIPNIVNKNVVIHTRITTHGTTSKENCHPFPISDNISDLKNTSLFSDYAIFHNGIIKSIEADKKHDLSDTMTYIRDILYHKYTTDKNFMNNDRTIKEIKEEIGSKMVILDNKGGYRVIGDFIEENGYLYSNYSYIPYDRHYDNYCDDYYYDDIFSGEFILLDYDEYIITDDGYYVYGDEFDFFLTYDGVYIEEGGEYIKVAEKAYRGNREEITLDDVYCF